jgi:glutathione S-transferase
VPVALIVMSLACSRQREWICGVTSIKQCRYGAAILDACAQLNERLAPLREKMGQEASMADIAAAAWMSRIDLCAHGFYKTPDITGTLLAPVPMLGRLVLLPWWPCTSF